MAERRIPDGDTLLRYVRRGQIGRDGEIDDAFRLRTGESTLSTTWVEYWRGLDRERQIANAIEATQMRKGRRDLIAEFPVGAAVTGLGTAGFMVEVRHRPTGTIGEHPPTPAHAEIIGLPRRDDTENSVRAARILAKAVSRTYPPLQYSPPTY